MIRRIRIEGYKSFAELDLRLAPLSVIFGPNASGKSNLLDAIYLLSRSVTCKTLTEAFEGHRGFPLESFYYGDCGYEKLLEKEYLTLTFEVDVDISPSALKHTEKRLDGFGGYPERGFERYLRYHIEIAALPATGEVGCLKEVLLPLDENGSVKPRQPLLHSGWDGDEFGDEKKRPLKERVGNSGTTISSYSSPILPVIPEMYALQAEMARWHVYYLEPRLLMREETPRVEIMSGGPHGEGLAAFLNIMRAKNPQAFEAFELAFRHVMPDDFSLDLQLTKDGRVSILVQENGVTFSGRLISEGTLRLLGLLAALHPYNDATVVAFEEPENGVHPARIKIIGDLLKESVANGKQVLVTTHSPLLAEQFDPVNLFVSRKEGLQSVIEPFRQLEPDARAEDIQLALEDRIIRGDYGG